MTRMQAARVFAKRRAKLRATRRKVLVGVYNHDGFGTHYAKEALKLVDRESWLITALWHDLNAAWDSEEPAHIARKGKE